MEPATKKPWATSSCARMPVARCSIDGAISPTCCGGKARLSAMIFLPWFCWSREASVSIWRSLCFAPTTSCSIIGATAAAGTKGLCLAALSEIELRTGEKYRVVLGGLGNAGYAWEPNAEGLPGVIFIRFSLPTPSPDVQPYGARISSEEHTFVIEVLAPGKTEVRFVLRRQWEKDVPPVRAISVWVTVTSMH